jgi:diaminopimelate dehydrogenase
MPDYFEPYDTTVTFITAEEMKEKHSSLPHGGSVIRSGNTGASKENNHVIEYSLKLDSNPEFTASVIIAFARAEYRMYQAGERGCKTVFDVPPKYLVKQDYNDLISHML